MGTSTAQRLQKDQGTCLVGQDSGQALWNPAWFVQGKKHTAGLCLELALRFLLCVLEQAVRPLWASASSCV